ncbi:LytR/AlgR family response regulator transcription factor [Christiangramia echinicola]|uniref:DNA-binding response regulator, LytR/AlgR family n=1 Tax=Christiangramia echinicola TaxID=279359 RepID=A0A1H1L0V2_9FLAO|nr:LytTR family DNA-binding domain-containing protein [Christiangramia echinicola]SDR67645.1 DNA-binding response regulator, LytR/AlgR family [Christiangramia echinicola]
MSSISCIIIDDEELARRLLDTYASKLAHLNCLGTFENPLEALSFIKSNPVDLIFLDIQMPQLKGTDFAELILNSGIRVIFTTAYSEYALQGFELSALDYLLKPISFKRFVNAVEKYPENQPDEQETIVIKSGYDLHKILLKDIIYIKSDSEYVHYYLENDKKIMALQSLTKLLSSLPAYFLRVHRSYIVNSHKVTGLKGRDLLLSDQIISVSDSYYETVKNKLF